MGKPVTTYSEDYVEIVDGGKYGGTNGWITTAVTTTSTAGVTRSETVIHSEAHTYFDYMDGSGELWYHQTIDKQLNTTTHLFTVDPTNEHAPTITHGTITTDGYYHYTQVNYDLATVLSTTDYTNDLASFTRLQPPDFVM